MLEEGSSTEAIPVFVAEGRRRHHFVRLFGATLGLLLAGWLAALATGIVGFAPLPAIPLPGIGPSHPTPPTHAAPVAADPARPSGAAEPALQQHRLPQRLGENAARNSSSSQGSPRTAASRAATSGSSSGSTTQPGSSGGVSTSTPGGTGTGSTTPPTGTGNGTTTPPTGTGGGSQSNSGSEPTWTPPETGTRGADPPRGKSSSAPGATTSTIMSGPIEKPSG